MAFFRNSSRTVADIDLGQAFRNNRQLQQFVLNDVTTTGRKLGTGSFGSVEEVIYQKIICAGKRIHEALLDVQNEGVPEMIQKYQQECQLMSSLRHPNITLFLGLCFLQGTKLPLLVMERLETSLDDLLEHMPNIPISLKRSILEDVASGLLYLHRRNPPVIHRDLTSNNVLLTSSLTAKITDMGNSRIADMRPGQMVRTLSKVPGTLVYMPPEAQDSKHRYGPSLDIFSFGHLALFTITQKFPSDLLPSTFYDAGNLQARNEVQRRGQYIETLEAHIGRYHPALVQLVKDCLHNDPDKRPTTDDLLVGLQGLRKEVEGEYGYPVKLDMVKVKLAKEVKQRDRQLTQQQERHETVLQGKNRELQQMTREIEELRLRETRLLQSQETEKQELETVIRGKDGELQTMTRNVEELQLRETQLLQSQESEKQEHEAVLRGKDGELQTMTRRVEDLQLRETQLREALQSQEAESRRLREELEKCQVPQQEGTKEPLKFPLQVRWKHCPDMPFGVNGYVQCVEVQGVVYVGGGLADSEEDDYKVMAYKTSSSKWTTLPRYKVRWFAMAVVDDQLVLVGGVKGRNDYSDKTPGTWRADSKKWTHPYPEMSLARAGSSAVVYKNWLVVAGGRGASGLLSSIEILNTDAKQWHSERSTPLAWGYMKTATVGDTCYFMGGAIEDGYTNKVYSVPLPALVTATSHAPKWAELPQLPVARAAPFTISGSLLSVGGKDKDLKAVSALHRYQPDTKQWVQVGDMTTQRHDCACILTKDNELFVSGGWKDGRLAKMEVAQL